MSLTTALFTAANGLNAHGEAVNVISDNIANISTTAFKSSQARFADVIASTVGDSSTATQGQGAALSNTNTDYTQGTLLPTGVPTDLALQGNGFFIMKGSFGGSSGTYFSRNGGFGIDQNGYLTNPNELIVQGYPVDGNGLLQTEVTDLKLGSVSLIPPRVTTVIDCRANVDSGSAVVSTFSLTAPATTSTFGTSVTAFDSRGQERNVDLYFTNNGSSSFTWYAVVDGSEVTGGTAGTATQVGTGTLTFNTDGSLATQSGTSFSANFLNATPSQVINVNFGTPTSAGGTGTDGMTSYSGSSNITYIAQDGNAEGALLGISVSQDGSITGAFTNGQPRLLGRVALASFSDQQELTRMGGTLYTATQGSGLPAVGPPGVGGRGSVVSGSLEQSNVNLSNEFITLMTTQRGFESNTRSIRAADQMLQELVNLSR